MQHIMKEATVVLSKDPVLQKTLHLPINIPYYDGDVNTYLYSSIISQQLSVKAADSIYNRFLNHYGGNSPIPDQLLDTDVETLRSLGLSFSKANYLHNVANHFLENDHSPESWHKKTDEEIIKELTSIKGVGVWTVQMVLMFCLARRDVFPILDLGVRNSMIELFEVKGDKKAINKKLVKLADRWKPYRSIASLYLWSYRNNG